MKETAIRVKELTKVYKLYNKPSDRLKESLGLKKKVKCREHYALNQINFSVEKGETVGIIGANGSGKSTILKIITGVLNPTCGQVEVNGRISALLELGAGFNSEYTGIENVYLNGTMIGFSKEEIDAKLPSILAFADIGDFVNQPVKTYSSGMFVRLAFAVAINIEPEILIVDEALSVGDVFFQAKCYRQFEEFKKQGKTILFVSHDMSSVSKYCDRVVLLNKGKKLAEGNPKEMIDLYKKVLVHQEDCSNDKEKNTSEDAKEVVWKEKLPLNPQVLSYGNGKAEIIDFAILDENEEISNNIMGNTDYSIKIKVKFLEHVEDPILAFTIKDLKGTEICGTNTMYEKQSISPKEKGNVITVTFKQKMNLQRGEYLLSLGCTGYLDGKFVVHHRLYDVCSIAVVNERNMVGFFDLESVVTIS